MGLRAERVLLLLTAALNLERIWFEKRTMQKVSDYRLRAEECRALAAEARSQQHRDMLLDMAATWDMLANARARNLAMCDTQNGQRDKA
jgi:hypothetical protein